MFRDRGKTEISWRPVRRYTKKRPETGRFSLFQGVLLFNLSIGGNLWRPPSVTSRGFWRKTPRGTDDAFPRKAPEIRPKKAVHILARSALFSDENSPAGGPPPVAKHKGRNRANTDRMHVQANHPLSRHSRASPARQENNHTIIQISKNNALFFARGFL